LDLAISVLKRTINQASNFFGTSGRFLSSPSLAFARTAYAADVGKTVGDIVDTLSDGFPRLRVSSYQFNFPSPAGDTLSDPTASSPPIILGGPPRTGKSHISGRLDNQLFF
jgi:hypothetical protein